MMTDHKNSFTFDRKASSQRMTGNLFLDLSLNSQVFELARQGRKNFCLLNYIFSFSRSLDSFSQLPVIRELIFFKNNQFQ